jgi:hypothetical protein
VQKFEEYSVEICELSNTVLQASQLNSLSKVKGASFLDGSNVNDDEMFSEQTATYINDKLTKIRIPTFWT